MYLTFEIKITVGYNGLNYDLKLFDLEYETIKQDLEEYAKDEGYQSIEEWLRPFLESDDYTEDEIQEILGYIDNSDEYGYGVDFYLPKREVQNLEKFLVKKYQEKVEQWILKVLTSNSDKTLNDLIIYEF